MRPTVSFALVLLLAAVGPVAAQRPPAPDCPMPVHAPRADARDHMPVFRGDSARGAMPPVALAGCTNPLAPRR